MTVRSFATRFNASNTAFSVSASRFAVISSNSSICGSATAALAMDKSCHCPCENNSGVHFVSYPFSVLSITSSNPSALPLLLRGLPNGFIIQRDLIAHHSRNHVEGLFYIAEQFPFLFLPDCRCRSSVDQNLSALRFVKS